MTGFYDLSISSHQCGLYTNHFFKCPNMSFINQSCFRVLDDVFKIIIQCQPIHFMMFSHSCPPKDQVIECFYGIISLTMVTYKERRRRPRPGVTKWGCTHMMFLYTCAFIYIHYIYIYTYIYILYIVYTYIHVIIYHTS